MSTRRSFLKISSAACAVSALPSGLFAQAPSSNPFTPANLGPYAQGLLNKATFDALLKTVFTVFMPTGIAYLRLDSCQSLDGNSLSSATSSSPARAILSRNAVAAKAADNSAGFNFILSFSVSGSPLTQGTFTVDHATLGRFALFLVPGGSPAAQVANATFNADPRAFTGLNPGKSFEHLLPPPIPANRGNLAPAAARPVPGTVTAPGASTRVPLALSLD